MSSIHDEEQQKEKGLIGQIISDLGGVNFTVQMTEKSIDLLKKFSKNDKMNKVLSMIKMGLPLTLIGYEVFTTIKYYREKKRCQYANQKKSFNVIKLLVDNYMDVDEYDLENHHYELGKEVIKWLIDKPQSKKFKIIDFYNNTFQRVDDPRSVEKGNIYVLIEYNENKFVIELELGYFNNNLVVYNSTIFSLVQNGFVLAYELKSAIFSEFIDSFDTEKNVIEYRNGLKTRPRCNINFKVSQFDIKSFEAEIHKSIEKNKARSYLMVGVPGVGKSTVMMLIESSLRKIPMVYITPSALGFKEDVVATFSFLRSISPCIAVFDDFDSFELADKRDRLFGEFIEQVDSLKHSECVIKIAALNEPQNIHNSLIDRRGRFDKVFFIDVPKTKKEVISILQNRFMKETKKEFPIKAATDKNINNIIKNKLTHSDICEIVDYLVINDIKIVSKTLNDSFNSLMDTKHAIQKCYQESIKSKDYQKTSPDVIEYPGIASLSLAHDVNSK